MPRAFKVVLLVSLLALVALAGVVAGCGSSSSSSGSSSSPSAGGATSKAYKIGITQIVTHPALDAAVQGFKDALAEKGFTNVTYDPKTRRATWRLRRASRRSSPASRST